MRPYTTFKKQVLRDQEIKRAYDALGPEFALVRTIIRRRIAKGLTQEELARKIGTKQSAISRLESGTYNPTVSFLSDVARALDSELKISL